MQARAARGLSVIRIDATWRATEPLDGRAGVRYGSGARGPGVRCRTASSHLSVAEAMLAQCVGSCGEQLPAQVDALQQDLLDRSVLRAEETPEAMRKHGNGKTYRAYLWSY